MSKDLARINQNTLDIITELVSSGSLSNFFDTEDEFLKFRSKVISYLMGNDPIVMNITITSDIVDYNKLNKNKRAIFSGNMVKRVSDQTSFVFNPNKTTSTK